MYFFLNDTATTEIYTLSLHDALPILVPRERQESQRVCGVLLPAPVLPRRPGRRGLPRPDGLHPDRGLRLFPHLDRKSTRLNSSHGYISYAVFCLKKKKKKYIPHFTTA